MLHGTPAKNAIGILKHGLLASKTKGKKKSVFCCTLSRRSWAYWHTVWRHKFPGVCIIEIDVPRSWLRKGRKRGIWHTGGRNVSPKRIKSMEFLP